MLKENIKYRIHWKSYKTFDTGCGTGLFSKEEAQRYADIMNEKYLYLNLHYWIEPEVCEEDIENLRTKTK